LRDRSSATFLLVFAITAGAFLFLAAAACGLFGLIQGVSTSDFQNTTQFLLLSLGTFWSALLLLPVIIFAVRSLQGKPEPQRTPLSVWIARLPYLLMFLVYPLVLFIGSQLSRLDLFAWWILPFLQIPAATLPVFWLVSLALRGFPPAARLKRWGAFSLGLTLSPLLILVIELTLIFVLGVALIVVLSSDQSKAMELLILAQRLQYAEPDPSAVLRILQPYLLQPFFISLVLGFVAVLVPLVEETLKPLGVWLFAGQPLTPAQGFAAGVLSGAGYALFENLFITAPGQQWALISIGRIGTTTMHIFTAGLTGYALAAAWSRGRYLRLGVCFAVSILIHALWNGLTILSVASTLQLSSDSSLPLSQLGQAAAIALLCLLALVFIGLLFANHRLRRYAIIPPPETELPDQPHTPGLPPAEPAQSELDVPES